MKVSLTTNTDGDDTPEEPFQPFVWLEEPIESLHSNINSFNLCVCVGGWEGVRGWSQINENL